MTLLGKVFIGLIFLMSITFCTYSVLAFATYIDHDSAAAGFEEAARVSEDRNTQLGQLRDTLKAEIEAEVGSRREALAALQIQYEASNAAFLAQEAEATRLREALTLAAQNNQSAQAEMKRLSDQVRGLRQDIVDTKANRDALYKRLIEAKVAFNSFQGTLRTLKDRAADLGN